MKGNRLRLASVVAMAAILLALPMAVAADEAEDVAAARAGTQAYTDVSVAEADGYGLPAEGPLHECIESFDNSGAMGLHYINGDLVGDTVVDAATPEALVYQPMAGGKLKLVALEYVVFVEAWDAENDHPPMLFDEMFMLIEEPNRYELPSFYALHAWLYEDNPAGTYEAFNPNVTCKILPDTATEAGGEGGPLAASALAPLTIALLALAAVFGLALTRRRFA
jgi:hypothetical protein